MLRLVVLVIMVVLVFRMLKFVFGGHEGAAPPRAPGPGAPPDRTPNGAGPGPLERLVEDPVCGVRIPESRAIRSGEHFFCSSECRDRFRGDPA